MASHHGSTRRNFLHRSLAAGAATASSPYWFSSSFAQTPAAPSDQPVIGCIGTGSRGKDVLQQTLPFAVIAAVCDVDSRHAAEAKALSGGKADIFEDYRRVLDRKDIQAVTVVTPDHWHTKIAIEAMQAGKDVYCEKPLTLTIDEGKKLCQVAKATGRVVQVGTQQRTEFDQRFLQAVAMVRAGRVGKVRKVQCAIGSPPSSPGLPTVSAPKELNWDLWLGQAPVAAFREMAEKKDDKGKVVEPYHSRCHYEFRWWYEYSGGKLTDWGAHHVDIASWALGLDKIGPSSVKVVSSKHPVPFRNGFPTQDDRYNTAVEFNVLLTFPEVELTIRHDTDNGILFEGTEGRLFVNRDKITGKPIEDLKDHPLPEDAIRNVYKGKEPKSHMGNFFDCVKSREEPISDVWSHHRALTNCHLANIALRLDRELKWDGEKEEMVGDPQAQAMVSREQRKGFEIVA